MRSVRALKRQIRNLGWTSIKTLRIPKAERPGSTWESRGRKIRFHEMKIEVQFYNPDKRLYYVEMHETVHLALRRAVVNLDDSGGSQ